MNRKQTEHNERPKLLDNGEVRIDLPPFDPQSVYRICSPRLKHPEQTVKFIVKIVEEIRRPETVIAAQSLVLQRDFFENA